jgi:hypothetical protein
MGDMRFVAARSRGDAQTLGSDRNGRMVDRLDVGAVPVQQEIACRLAAVSTSRHITLDYLEQRFLALLGQDCCGTSDDQGNP